MKLSERDKKLLILLVAIGIVALSYFFGYKKLTEKTETLNAEIANLELRHNSLIKIANNEKKYVADTKANVEECTKIMSKYSDNNAQESLIMYLRDFENELDTVWIKAYTMPQPKTLHTFMGGKGYGTQTTMGLTIEASYSDFKKLLEEVIAGDKKNYISSVSIAYNEIDDKVTSTMSFNKFTIVNPNEEIKDKVKLENILIGHDNIFISAIFKPGSSAVEDEGNRILNDNDFQLVVSPVGSGDATVSINKTGDREGTTTLKTDYNGTSDVSITIAEDEGGQYKATYKIGANEKSVTFVPGENLDLLICSTPRIDNDNVAVNLTIKNTTTMTFNLKVINDDDVSPRIRLVNQEGSIMVIK